VQLGAHPKYRANLLSLRR